MRNSFIKDLSQLAKADPSIFLITGDLGYGVLDEFEKLYPNQYLNAGIAEQSMLSAAAGMASRGFKVFVYSIANFPTFRALEQIRNDICYMDNPVTIVSVGAGLSYGSLGYSHHAVEDISIMRALPNMDIYSPCDPSDVEFCLEEIIRNSKPAYLRLGKGGEEVLSSKESKERLPYRNLRSGKDGTLLFTGAIGAIALEAADELQRIGKSVSVFGLNQICDSSLQVVIENTMDAPVLTIEEHRLQGGVGSWLLEGFFDRNIIPRFGRIGLAPKLEAEIGSREYLLGLHKLTSKSVVEKFTTISN